MNFFRVGNFTFSSPTNLTPPATQAESQQGSVLKNVALAVTGVNDVFVEGPKQLFPPNNKITIKGGTHRSGWLGRQITVPTRTIEVPSDVPVIDRVRNWAGTTWIGVSKMGALGYAASYMTPQIVKDGLGVVVSAAGNGVNGLASIAGEAGKKAMSVMPEIDIDPQTARTGIGISAGTLFGAYGVYQATKAYQSPTFNNVTQAALGLIGATVAFAGTAGLISLSDSDV